MGGWIFLVFLMPGSDLEPIGSLLEVLIEPKLQGQVKIHSTAHLPKELRLVLTH